MRIVDVLESPDLRPLILKRLGNREIASLQSTCRAVHHILKAEKSHDQQAIHDYLEQTNIQPKKQSRKMYIALMKSTHATWRYTPKKTQKKLLRRFDQIINNGIENSDIKFLWSIQPQLSLLQIHQSLMKTSIACIDTIEPKIYRHMISFAAKKKCTYQVIVDLIQQDDIKHAVDILNQTVKTLTPEACEDILNLLLQYPQKMILHITTRTFAALIRHLSYEEADDMWDLLWDDIDSINRHRYSFYISPQSCAEISKIFNMIIALLPYISQTTIGTKINKLSQQVRHIQKKDTYLENLYTAYCKENMRFFYRFLTTLQLVMNQQQIDRLFVLIFNAIKNIPHAGSLEILLKYATLADIHQNTLSNLINLSIKNAIHQLSHQSWQEKKLFFNSIGKYKHYFSNIQCQKYIDLIQQHAKDDLAFPESLFYFIDYQEDPEKSILWQDMLTQLDYRLDDFYNLLKKFKPFPTLYARHLWAKMHANIAFFMDPARMDQTMGIIQQLYTLLKTEDIVIMWGYLLPIFETYGALHVLPVLKKIVPMLPPDVACNTLKKYLCDNHITYDQKIVMLHILKPYIYPGLLAKLLPHHLIQP